MTTILGDKCSGKDAKELYELKEKARKYYVENGVPNRMEDILNSMFHDNPPDVYGHLANYFEEFSKTPVITKLQGRECYDSRGQPTLQTDVYCMIKNKEKMKSSCMSASVTSDLLDSAKVEERDAENEARKTSVTAAVTYINTDICNKLEGIDPTHQSDADEVVYKFIQKMMDEAEAERVAALANDAEEVPSAEKQTAETPAKKGKKGKASANTAPIIPEDPKEAFVDGSVLVSAVSQAVSVAGAASKGVPLYRYIATLRDVEAPDSMKLPLPMVTIIQSGRAAPGKNNCIKEYMIIPKPGLPLRESMQNILGIYSHVSKALYTKGGVVARNVNDQGALCPVFDKPEQGLDMLMDAMTALSLTPGEDFHIAINIAAHEMFDFDKGKYEVMTGQLKGSDDYVEFLVEILGRYPAIIAIIDPLRKQDRDQWMRLCDRVSVAGFVVGDHGYHRPGILRHQELDEKYPTSGIVLGWEQMTTLTDLVEVAKKMEAADNQIIVTASQGETSSDILADLAVGLNARFLKVGAPCRGERLAKLNRLLHIEAELEEQGMLGYHEPHLYPRIEMPLPVAGEGEGEELPSPSPPGKKEKKK